MAIGFNDWKKEQNRNGANKFTPETGADLQKLSNALKTFSRNLNGEEFNNVDPLLVYSEKLDDLSKLSSELSEMDKEQLKASAEKIKAWEDAVSELDGLGEYLKQNYNDMIDFGFGNQDLKEEVDLEGFNSGLDVLDSVFGIKTDRGLMKAHHAFLDWQGRLPGNNELAPVNGGNLYSPEIAAKVKDAAVQLENMRQNLVGRLGEDNELSEKMTAFSRNLTVLSEKSEWLADPENADDEAYDENKKAWERAYMELSGLNGFMQTELDDMLFFGAVNEENGHKVEMKKFVDGLEALKKIYGVENDIPAVKNTYNKYIRSRDGKVIYDIVGSYSENDLDYKAPDAPEEQFNEALNVIDDTIEAIHSKHKFSPFEFSSEEHEKLIAAGNRLKKAFENPDLYYDPAEKIAAIDEAIAMSAAYKRKKFEDKGIDMDAPDFNDEESPASTGMGESRFNAADRLNRIGRILRQKAGSKLATAADDMAFALKEDPALKNNRTLLNSLNGHDSKLNSKRFAGLFSGSSDEHQQLKDSVDELKKALEPPHKLIDARTDKLAALKKARDKAKHYIDRKREDAHVAPGAKWDGPGSDMGKDRYSAAEWIYQLTQNEIEIMEKEMKKSPAPGNSFRAFKRAESNKDTLTSKAYKKSSESLLITTNRLESRLVDYLPGGNEYTDDVRHDDDYKADENSPVGVKFGILMKYLNDFGSTEGFKLENPADHNRTEEEKLRDSEFNGASQGKNASAFNAKKDMIKKLANVFTNEQDMNTILKGCENAHEAEGEEDFVEMLAGTLEKANKLYGLDLPAEEVRSSYERFKQQRLEINQAHAAGLEDWKKAYPCRAADVEDYDITDQADIDRINRIEGCRKDAKHIADFELKESLKGSMSDEDIEKFRSLSEKLRGLWHPADRIDEDRWKELGTTIQDFKDFLNTGSNYTKLVMAAEKAGEQNDDDDEIEDPYDYKEALQNVIKGLNEFHKAGIDLAELNRRAASPAERYYGGQQPIVNDGEKEFDLTKQVNIDRIKEGIDSDKQLSNAAMATSGKYTGRVVGDHAKNSRADLENDELNNAIILNRKEKERDLFDMDDDEDEFNDPLEDVNEINTDSKGIKTNQKLNESSGSDSSSSSDSEPDDVSENNKEDEKKICNEPPKAPKKRICGKDGLVDFDAELENAQNSLKAKYENNINDLEIDDIKDDLVTVATVNMSKLRWTIRMDTERFEQARATTAEHSFFKNIKGADTKNLVEAAVKGNGVTLLEELRKHNQKISALKENGNNHSGKHAKTIDKNKKI